jgi:hypothetical protein
MNHIQLTIMTHKLYALWQCIHQLLIKTSCYVHAVKGPVYD